MSLIKDLQRSYYNFKQNFDGVSVSGPRLLGGDGSTIGYAERITYNPNEITVEGWADAEKITISNSKGIEISKTHPSIQRKDVQAALRSNKHTYGFVIKSSKQNSPIKINIYKNGIKAATCIPELSAFMRFRGKIELKKRYIKLLYSAMPDVIRWIRHHDRSARHRVGAIFRSIGKNAVVLNMDALGSPAWPNHPTSPVTIIIPVYQGVDLLDKVIARVNENTDLPWHLILINDASPDPKVGKCLQKWRNHLTSDKVTLINNTENLGFVKSVNIGLAAAITRNQHVILLNSDALVPPRWSSRLIEPLINKNKIASVTPFSNNAEIANVPIPGRSITLFEGEGDALDEWAQIYNNIDAVAEVPTGVGFCMAINIEALQLLPALDLKFGKGYGEEVDWCQRAVALGWRNLLTAGLFVEHYGGKSFGVELKQSLTRKNNEIISYRYPNFDEQVQTFIAIDPLRAQRLMLGINMAANRAHSNGRKLAIFLGHGMGGGAENYLKQRVEAEISQTGYAVIIRTIPDSSWHIELHTENGTICGKVNKISSAMPFFSNLSGLHVVYSCGVGSTRPRDIPRTLSLLAGRPNSSLEVTFNDYFPLSPSYTLLDSHDIYRGLPLDADDPAHRFVTCDGAVIYLDEWKKMWGDVMRKAMQLTTFSPSSADIVSSAWPELSNRIRIQPHRITDVPKINTESSEPVIGVLGNISRAKGAKVLEDVSRTLASSGAGRLILIGNIEPGFIIAKPSLVLGSYEIGTLESIVKKYGITKWFFPSIWPETFSYAVHEMIATGLPVWSFNIGGQADAVNAALMRGQGGGLLSLRDGIYSVSDIESILYCSETVRDERVANVY